MGLKSTRSVADDQEDMITVIGFVSDKSAVTKQAHAAAHAVARGKADGDLKPDVTQLCGPLAIRVRAFAYSDAALIHVVDNDVWIPA